MTALHFAAQAGATLCLRSPHDSPGSVHCFQEFSLLFLAAPGDAKLVELLVKRKASLTLLNKQAKTPLDLAQKPEARGLRTPVAQTLPRRHFSLCVCVTNRHARSQKAFSFFRFAPSFEQIKEMLEKAAAERAAKEAAKAQGAEVSSRGNDNDRAIFRLRRGPSAAEAN